MKLRFGFVIALIAAMAVTGVALVAEAAQKKIIYFTGTSTPNTTEKAAIAKLNVQAAAPYQIVVRNSYQAGLRGTHVETADYVAGAAITANYRAGGVDSGTPLYPVYDPNHPVTPAAFRDGGT